MSEIAANQPSPSCFLLFSTSRIQESQMLGPDPFLSRGLSRGRDARGRFAKGSSGNLHGRPRGIPNPTRRVPHLWARPMGARSLLDLIDRKPHLLRALATQLLPPPLAPIDLAERLGIDLSSLSTTEDFPQVLLVLLEAIVRGEIAPAEAVHIARRAHARLRAIRRLRRIGGYNPRFRA